MSTVHASGTLTSTVTTEQTLTTQSTDIGTAIPIVDISNVASGQYVTLRAKTKILNGGTTRTLFTRTFGYYDAQIEPIVNLDPIISDQEYVLTLQYTSATSTAFPWKVLGP